MKVLTESGGSDHTYIPGVLAWVASPWCVLRLLIRSGCKSEYADFRVRSVNAVDLWNFQKHASSRAHLDAVATALGDDKSPSKAPSQQEFEIVLKDRLDGLAYSAGTSGRKGRDKCQQMSWCLSEALLQRDRAILRKAASIAIHQDACAPRLLVRFSVCTESFEIHKGCMGLAKHFGTTSTHLKNATAEMFRIFCTPFLDAPCKTRITKGLKPKLDTGLYDHIVKHVHVFDADGASDEQRAGRILSTRCCGSEPVLPNICAVLKDKTHASRRLVSRPWAADPYLADLLTKYITNEGSIVHTIQNSPDITNTFQKHCAAITNCPVNGARIRNLQYSKHRFDSTSKPLGRFVMFFDAVWGTASELMAISKNSCIPRQVLWQRCPKYSV